MNILLNCFTKSWRVSGNWDDEDRDVLKKRLQTEQCLRLRAEADLLELYGLICEENIGKETPWKRARKILVAAKQRWEGSSLDSMEVEGGLTFKLIFAFQK